PSSPPVSAPVSPPLSNPAISAVEVQAQPVVTTDPATATPTQPAIQPTAGTIDPAIGGQLDTPEGRLHVLVPLAASTDILQVSVVPGAPASADPSMVSPLSMPLSPLFRFGTTMFQVNALDGTGSSVPTLFQQATISIVTDWADPLAVGGPANLSLAYFDTSKQAWVALASRVNADGSVSSDTDHLGQFVVLRKLPTLSVCMMQDSSFWSSADSTAIIFGPALANSTFLVLGQVGDRYQSQDNSGAVGWLDLSATGACAPPLTMDATTSVPTDGSTTPGGVVETPSDTSMAPDGGLVD
ncbi:MAG: hypothetical protein M3069_24640, partial [Chloroflexota bacterium]|nr:hypothetical protein [Chloroflexota bacterium]